jgi:RNA polymerase sigma-70 factor (ECF subfamily)
MKNRAAAFDALVVAHTDRLCRFVYGYVGSRETAEDIVQEVFLSVWERGHDWNVHDPLPYLYKAARNRAISHARHGVIVGQHEFEARTDDANAQSHTDVEDDLAESELSSALADAIAKLPEKCRLVFTMSRAQGLSHLQIAEALGLSTKTVESHIWRALTALRAALAPYLALLLMTLQ